MKISRFYPHEAVLWLGVIVVVHYSYHPATLPMFPVIVLGILAGVFFMRWFRRGLGNQEVRPITEVLRGGAILLICLRLVVWGMTGK